MRPHHRSQEGAKYQPKTLLLRSKKEHNKERVSEKGNRGPKIYYKGFILTLASTMVGCWERRTVSEEKSSSPHMRELMATLARVGILFSASNAASGGQQLPQ